MPEAKIVTIMWFARDYLEGFEPESVFLFAEEPYLKTEELSWHVEDNKIEQISLNIFKAIFGFEPEPGEKGELECQRRQ